MSNPTLYTRLLLALAVFAVLLIVFFALAV